MNSDSTYVIEAERVITTDTVFYRINKTDLKTMYAQAFGDIIDKDVAKDQLVLTFTYVPLILIFAILITVVNVRWNNAYKRIKDKQADAYLSEEDKKNIEKLDLQYYHIPGRILFYLVVWVVSAVFDTLFILYGIFEVPWAALLATIFTISKVLIRLVGGSTLMGIDDSELIENYGKYIRGMLVDSITGKLKNIINKK